MLDQAIQERLGQAPEESGAARILGAVARFALDGEEPHDLVGLIPSDR